MLKCHFHPSTIINNKGCLTHIFVSLTSLHSCFQVLYTSDEQEWNKTKTHSRRHTLCRISHPTSHPYREGPHVRGNGATHDAPEDKDKDQRIYHPAEDQAERLLGGVGRPPGSADPLVPVQVHFEEEWLPRHLITTFHMCIWREPTTRAINRASPPPTHTLIPPFKEGSPLSCSLS